MPLLCGSTIILTEQGTVADGVKIKFYLEKYSISLMQATPLSWEILLKQGWNNDGHMKILEQSSLDDVRSLELMDAYLLEKIRKNAADAEEINFNLSSFSTKC